MPRKKSAFFKRKVPF